MRVKSVMFFAGALAISTVVANAVPAPPAGSTGICKDGTYSTAAHKQGACRGHKGVQEWLAADADAAAKPSMANPLAPVVPSVKSTAAPRPTPAPAAMGGGAGQVWVNTKSKVYHCSGTAYYGKTKAGTYMTEAAALAAGNHADHGKACK